MGARETAERRTAPAPDAGAPICDRVVAMTAGNVRPPMHTSFSLLRLSAGARLAYVTAAVAMLWLCVLWALT
jgi:hypothetical protein